MPIKYFPETWKGNVWRPKIDEVCMVIEAYDIFNEKERVIVEVTIPGRNVVVVSKLLDGNSIGQIPIENIEKIEH